MLAVILLACLVCCVSGCQEEEPVDTSFFIARDENGAEFRRGEKGDVIAKLELPRTEDGEYTGDLKLYLGDELWARVWQEDDKGVQKVYLQSPDVTMLLDSWTDGDVPLHTTIRYNGAGDDSVSVDGVNLGMELPQTDDTTSYVLLSVNEEGTLQLNIYVDRKISDGMIEQLSSFYLYRLTEDRWTEQDRVASVSRSVATGERNLPSGTYTVSVDVTRDGSTRQLLWERTGLGEDGYRFRVTCTQDGKQVALLQTLSDTLGDVIVENASFDGDSPFTVDPDGRVRRDGDGVLFTGQLAEYAYSYDGTTKTELSPETLKAGTVGGFSSALVQMDEVYEGDRSADLQLTRPKCRRYFCLQFRDVISNTAVEVPVAYSDWFEDGTESVEAEDIDAHLSLQPDGSTGWDLMCTPVSGAVDLAGNGSASETAGLSARKAGSIVIGTSTDANGETVYNGDVQITVPGADAFRLYRRSDGQVCRVYAELGETKWLLAACPAEMGSAPALTVTRYVELEDYTTPLTIYKLFYDVRLPDGTVVAQFMTTNDGRLVVRMTADPNLTEPSSQGSVQGGADDTQGSVQGGLQPQGSPDGTQDNAQDGTDDAQDGQGAQGSSAARADVSTDRKPTNIEIEYAFRFRDDAVVATFASTESIVKNGTVTDAASIRNYGEDIEGITILAGRTTDDGEKQLFGCIQGLQTEASIIVALSDSVSFEPDAIRLRDRVTGQEYTPIQVRGGLLYVDGVCVDSLSGSHTRIADKSGSIRDYVPSGNWTTFETEHLIVRVRLVQEYRDAEKALDGTVITPAKARDIVWVEVTERSSGDSWSFPVGYGSWGRKE